MYKIHFVFDKNIEYKYYDCKEFDIIIRTLAIANEYVSDYDEDGFNEYYGVGIGITTNIRTLLKKYDIEKLVELYAYCYDYQRNDEKMWNRRLAAREMMKRVKWCLRWKTGLHVVGAWTVGYRKFPDIEERISFEDIPF